MGSDLRFGDLDMQHPTYELPLNTSSRQLVNRAAGAGQTGGWQLPLRHTSCSGQRSQRSPSEPQRLLLWALCGTHSPSLRQQPPQWLRQWRLRFLLSFLFSRLSASASSANAKMLSAPPKIAAPVNFSARPREMSSLASPLDSSSRAYSCWKSIAHLL
jgi:hypothetical protein